MNHAGSKRAKTLWITKLGFYRNTVSDNAVMFFAQWDSLRYLEFRDTPVPESWVAMLQALNAFDPPAETGFNRGATEAEIADLEQNLGMPLPKYFRAFLEINNGQSKGNGEPWRWPTCQEIESLWSDETSYHNVYVPRDDFDPLCDIGANPNFIEVVPGMGVSLVDGRLAGLLSPQGPYETDRVKNMKHLLTLYIVYLDTQRAEPDSGKEVQRGTMLTAPDFWMGWIGKQFLDEQLNKN